MEFLARDFRFRFPSPTVIMGILNVTPDSFSDGGKYCDANAAIQRAHQMVHEGAGIIDIGGESTRPKATPVSETDELRRVIPVVERLAIELKVPLSVDTQKPGVAKHALESGACIINDIAASRKEPTMWEHVAEYAAGYVCMHMQGTPQTMQHNPAYGDVLLEIGQFFEERLSRLKEHGVPEEHVLLDVGIGFGKTLSHNLELLKHLFSFKRLTRPLVLGVSRKSFIGKLFDVETDQRLAGTLACTCWALRNGVQILRTHDVAETVQAVRMWEALEDPIDPNRS